PTLGAAVFARACAACHALQPDRNMTGPSLAGVWGRKAGGLDSFSRYSPALRSANVVWDATTLNQWLRNPAQFIPRNRMTFRGMPDSQSRADLIAYLEQASSGASAETAQNTPMGGMMGGGEPPNLKKLAPAEEVKAIRYCRDTYHVTTADGETHDFWERNLRLKTDSGDSGPPSGTPALVGAGMMGDRADVIFASPQEISRFITPGC
ncbi:MAG TPA: c-type cytochrome, partial [Stellaceae bacterium]|nr:c-type cytochrome [Stellaceae bacterium]